MKPHLIIIIVCLLLGACRSGSNNIHVVSQPACKVQINFASRGSGIDHTRYDELTQSLKLKNVRYTEKAWGKEGEKEICIPLTELKGKEKTDFIEQLKTFDSKATLVSVSVN